MNWDLAANHWHQFKGTVRARWTKLTPELLDEIAGQRPRLLQQLQELYGIKRTDAERELRAFEERNKNFRPKN
jgi:uncharacterized protein YjbJ (UPF0337 family)